MINTVSFVRGHSFSKRWKFHLKNLSFSNFETGKTRCIKLLKGGKESVYNYFMLIGYVVKDVELREVKDDKRVCSLRLAVKRDFANTNGEYESDFINVTLWDFLAENVAELLKKGSRVAVKGRICPSKQTIGDIIVYTNELYADRVIFLGSSGQTKEFSKEDSRNENN